MEPLTDLLLRKTDGNPFFMRQFLKSLHARGLLLPAKRRPDDGRMMWKWDLNAIQSLEITDNVVELMAEQMRELGEDTRNVVQLAGALGNRFDLRGLATVAEMRPTDAARSLWDALTAGMIVALDSTYKLAALEVDGLSEVLSIRYKFAHDRIQQAAYSLIDEQDRAAVHWGIGRRLLQGARTEEERSALLFDITGHLNVGRSLADTEVARLELVELNLEAWQKAKRSAAFSAAADFAEAGVAAMSESMWQTHYELILRLHHEAAETAFLSGRYEPMDGWIGAVETNARGILDTVFCTRIKCLALNAQHDLTGAIEHAVQMMARLGVEIR